MSQTSGPAGAGADGSQLNCTLAGYRQLVNRIIKLALVAISVNVSIIEMILSGLPDLAIAFRLTYDFLLGAGDWIGYAIGAAYYFGLEFGYGEYLCQASQYGYIVIYYLNYAISFGQDA